MMRLAEINAGLPQFRFAVPADKIRRTDEQGRVAQSSEEHNSRHFLFANDDAYHWRIAFEGGGARRHIGSAQIEIESAFRWIAANEVAGPILQFRRIDIRANLGLEFILAKPTRAERKEEKTEQQGRKYDEDAKP